MGTFWLTLISLATGVLSFFGKVFDYIRDQKMIELGKQINNNEINKKEQEIKDKQTDIIMTPAKKEDIEKKLEDGKF